MKQSRKLPRIIELADRAIREAVRNVMIEHKQKNLPLVVWHNNRIVHIPPSRLPTH